MRHRTLVQNAASLRPRQPAAAPAQRRVRPGAARQALKASVGGGLIEVQPLFAPCAAAPQGAACADLTHDIRNPLFSGEQPGGTQVSGWLDAWTPARSAYAVLQARQAAGVAAAVNCAREHRCAHHGVGSEEWSADGCTRVAS